MKHLHLEGRRYAIEQIGQPINRVELEKILANLEQSARSKPSDFAEGIRSVIRAIKTKPA